MKFIKLSTALFVMVNALLLFSCKKNDNPGPGNGNIPQDTIPHDTVPEDTTVPLLTKVLYYNKLSDTIGIAPEHRDSIYYNDKQQISQVVSLGTTGITTYSFVYNDEGLLASLAVHRAIDHYIVKYELVYKGNRLDEIIYRDTIAAPTELFGKLAYSDQGKLLNLTAYVNDMGQNIELYKTNYIRNAAGTVDSLNILSGTFVAQSAHPSETVSPVNQIWKRVDKAYLFLLATREQYMLFPPGANNNLFLHQFLNADDNFFNDGIFNSYSSTVNNKYEQYNTAYAMNADSTLKTYQYYQGPQGATEETIGAKFSYIRK